MVDIVQFTNIEETRVIVEPEGWSMQYPANTWHQDEIDAWIALGNAIAPFNPYQGMSIEQAYDRKENEIFLYAESLIRDAYSNPYDGITVNPVRYRLKVNRRKANRADKLAGEITLTQTEKDAAKNSEKLSGYEVKITDDQDKAEINLHKLNAVIEIMSFDVVAESWTVWIPPV